MHNKRPNRKFPCRIDGCRRSRGEDMIMCRSHWFQVPELLRNRVWQTYRTAKGSPAHLRAIADAIKAVESA